MIGQILYINFFFSCFHTSFWLRQDFFCSYFGKRGHLTVSHYTGIQTKLFHYRFSTRNSNAMVPYLTLPGPMGPSSLQSRSRTHSLATYSWLQTLAWAFLLSGWLVSSGNFPPLSFLCGIRLKPFRGLGNLERGKKSRLPTAFWLPRRRSWSSFLFGTVRS